jgi:hypothetical protein
MKLSQLTPERQTVIKLEIPDGSAVRIEEITVKFRPPTAALLDQAEERARMADGYPIVEQLAELLTDTGIDTEEGERIPPTAEGLRLIPFVILRQLFDGVLNATLPKKAS